MNCTVYVGTYTGGEFSDSCITGSEGIYGFCFDAENGVLNSIGVFGENEIDPGFLVSDGKYILAENERKDNAVIRCFKIDDDASLVYVDQVRTFGSKCAHVCLDKHGPYVIGAVYSTGNVVVAKINQSTGELRLTDEVNHEGRSIVPVRQEGPHAHSACFTPDGKLLAVPDLGADRVVLYKLDRGKGILLKNDIQPYVTVKPGEGPRHLTFSPDGKYAFLLTEIGNNIYVYEVDTQRGTLKEKNRYALLPDSFSGTSHAAELKITSDGRYLYACNRGHDSISGFTVLSSGELVSIGHFSSGGRGPRHICLSPNEDFIIAANKDSNEVCVIERNTENGTLGTITDRVSVPAPACICCVEI